MGFLGKQKLKNKAQSKNFEEQKFWKRDIKSKNLNKLFKKQKLRNKKLKQNVWKQKMRNKKQNGALKKHKQKIKQIKIFKKQK